MTLGDTTIPSYNRPHYADNNSGYYQGEDSVFSHPSSSSGNNPAPAPEPPTPKAPAAPTPSTPKYGDPEGNLPPFDYTDPELPTDREEALKNVLGGLDLLGLKGAGSILKFGGKVIEKMLVKKLTKNIAKEAGELAAGSEATLGSKLDYFLGKATGNAHNIERSQEMLRQLESVGLPDTTATRELLTKNLTSTLNDASSILETQANGRVIRESLLMGPQGGLKLQTVWDGVKLITGTLFGGK